MLLCRRSSAGNPTPLSFGDFVREDSDNPLYLISDHLGSTSLVVDSLGQEVAKQTYLPFGEIWGSSVAGLPTDYTFTGQREAEEIGLMYYVARWYDSEIGHFIQADTIVPGAGNTLAWNRYMYNFDNPIRYSDPSGHIPVINDPEARILYLFDKLQRMAGFSNMSDENSVENLEESGNSEFSLNPRNDDNSTIEKNKLLDEIPEWVEKFLRWAQEHPWLAKNGAENWFSNNGRRIFMIDYGWDPYKGQYIWHFNSDLKALKNINHTDLTPIITTTVTLIEGVTNFASQAITDPFIIFFSTDPFNWEDFLPQHETIDT